MSKIVRFIVVLIVLSISSKLVSSKKVRSTENSGDLLYEYEASECLCQSNGVCELIATFAYASPSSRDDIAS